MKKLVKFGACGVLAAVIAVGIYFSVVPAEKRNFNAIPEGGVVRLDDAAENAFTEVSSDITASVIKTQPAVEPYSLTRAGEDIFFLGKGLLNDRYDGTVGLYKVTGSIDEAMEGGHVEALVLDGADLQKNEWSGLQSLGDVLIWKKGYRADGKVETGDWAGYHKEDGYIELPLALQLKGDGRVMTYGDSLYWFKGNDLEADLMMWKEGCSQSECIASEAFRPHAVGGSLDCGLLAYNKGGKCIVRMDLTENRPLDKFPIVSEIGIKNVFCSEDYIVFCTFDGEVFCWAVEEGICWQIGKAARDGTGRAYAGEVHLDGDRMLHIRENQMAVYDLASMTVQRAELPELRYSDFLYGEDGTVLACSADGRCFVDIRYR